MKTSRRRFISTAAIAGGTTAMMPFSSCQNETDHGTGYPDYSMLDMAREKPVLKKELFPSPVVIDKLELLQDRNNFICRVRSKDGAEGLSIGHPFISNQGYPMFGHSLHHHFAGKDARDLDALIFDAVEKNIKKQGVPLCVQIATIEFAILDMLGNIAGEPVGKLLGEIHHPEIDIYLGTQIDEMRTMEPEKSLELVARDLEETQAKAFKLRAGRGDNLGMDHENAPGRTEKLIRLAREKFGDELVLMIDGNGTYSLEGAIRLGQILEEYNFYFYEEPVPWDWYEEQKRVAEALTIPMAGGEEEFGMHAFRWLIAHNAFEILQPDTFYFGGMIRSMKVARMAEAAGKVIVPHMSGGGLGYLYMLHLTSACLNAGKYHEFKMFDTYDANGTPIPIESKTEPFSSVEGVVKVPTGAGLGIRIDPGYVATHKVIYG
jgi:L-alanine-DL-glutamate epimerase-like enolase superfamily enzyme